MGGGIYYHGNGNMVIRKNIIENNIARLGAGIYTSGGRDTDTRMIDHNLFLNNDARYIDTTTTGAAGGGIRVQGGYLAVRNNIFSGNIALTSNGTSAGISQNTAPAIAFNLFHQNTAKTSTVTETHADTIFTDNTIIDNTATDPSPKSAVLVGTWRVSYPFVNRNNFLENNTTYALWNDNAEGTDDINVEYNWWGGSTEADVLAAIYDNYDDQNKGVADYTPWLSEMNLLAPISPPRGLTVAAKDLNAISVQWQPNPETDLQEYRFYWSKTPGIFYANQSSVGTDTSHTLDITSTGTYYIAVTACDTNYGSVTDEPATLVNEKQTYGNESWYSEITVEIKDDDADGVEDGADNCPLQSNTGQEDTDSDGTGDSCDNCPDLANPDQADGDNDDVGDMCDNCPSDQGKIAPGVCGCGIADIDLDSDKLLDCIEQTMCTNPDDADTDDDGIMDGDEDADLDGLRGSTETDPCNVDTDGDGIQDGTESGVTVAGTGTDSTVFVPDADPSTTTNPLDADADGDGVKDGEEDTNFNGRVDEGESDPNDKASRPSSGTFFPIKTKDGDISIIYIDPKSVIDSVKGR